MGSHGRKPINHLLNGGSPGVSGQTKPGSHGFAAEISLLPGDLNDDLKRSAGPELASSCQGRECDISHPLEFLGTNQNFGWIHPLDIPDETL